MKPKEMLDVVKKIKQDLQKKKVISVKPMHRERNTLEKTMTRQTEEYEFARKIMKRERKEPNIYTANRKEAMLNRVAKDFGEKGVKEFVKEFRKDFERK